MKIVKKEKRYMVFRLPVVDEELKYINLWQYFFLALYHIKLLNFIHVNYSED